VHALTPEPRSFVEPVLRSARGRHADERIQEGALRRRPPERKLQLHALAQAAPGKPGDDRRCAHVVLSTARRPRDGHAHVRGGLEPRAQRAAVERIEPRAAPPPAPERERDRNQLEGTLFAKGGHGAPEQ
jgi:hypothetical protein